MSVWGKQLVDTGPWLIAREQSVTRQTARAFEPSGWRDGARPGAGEHAARTQPVVRSDNRLAVEERRLAREGRATILGQAIEQEVIPRLALGVRAEARRRLPLQDGSARAGSSDIGRVAELAMAPDNGELLRWIEAMQHRGMPAEALIVDFLTPAARRLGELWDADLCHFTQVTIGVMRLQQALRALMPAFQDLVLQHMPEADGGHGPCGNRLLLVPVPGEQHSFGMVMVAEYFRRAGWSVSGGAAVTAAELLARVRAAAYSVIGFSVGSERQLDALASCIRQVRRQSRNASIGVMVGGPLFIAQPELVARVGADTTAIDGRDAVRQAHRLQAMLAARA